MPWPKTGTTQYHAQLGLPDKGRAVKGLVVCNGWDLEPLDLLNGMALGCYQLSPEVLIVCMSIKISLTTESIELFFSDKLYAGPRQLVFNFFIVKKLCTVSRAGNQK